MTTLLPVHYDPQSRARQRYRRAGLGYATIVLARVSSFVIGIVTIPIALPYLGTERFGMWMTITSFAILLGFTNLGVGASLMNEIARSEGHGDRHAQRASASNALAISIAMAALLGLTFLALGSWFDWSQLLNVTSDSAASEAGPSVAIFVACFVAAMPLSLSNSVWNGLQRTYVAAICTALGPLIGVAGVALAVHLGLGTPALVAAASGGPLIATVVSFVLLFFARRDLRPSLGLVSLGGAKSLLRVGLAFFLLQVAIAVGMGADAIILAHVVGPAAVAEYAVVARLFNAPLQLGSSVVVVLWPSLAEARSRGEDSWVQLAMHRIVVITAVATLPLVVALALAGPGLAQAIGRTQVAPDAALFVAFAIATIVVVFTTTRSVFLNSAGVVWPQVGLFLPAALVNVLLGVWLAMALESSGVVWATAICYAVVLTVLVWMSPRWMSRRVGPHEKRASSSSGPRPRPIASDPQ